MAVGQDLPQALADQWDGTSWTATAPVSPSGSTSLSSVSCTSPTFCIAVGNFGQQNAPLAEEWDGSEWSIQSTIPTTPLSSISCASPTFCMAVGFASSNATVTSGTAEWNGTAWESVTAPSPGSGVNVLAGVSCLTSSWCVAVGEYASSAPPPPYTSANDSLALSWDGTSWSVQPTPNAEPSIVNFPQSVSCSSTSRCLAVGNTKVVSMSGGIVPAANTYSWNGSTWSLVLVPNTSYPGTVSCPPNASCVATSPVPGSSPAVPADAMVDSWDGTAWSEIPGTEAGGGGGAGLDSISCPTDTFCAAVGYLISGPTSVTPFAEIGSPPASANEMSTTTTTTSASTTTSMSPVSTTTTVPSPVVATSRQLAFTGVGDDLTRVLVSGLALTLAGSFLLLPGIIRRRWGAPPR